MSKLTVFSHLGKPFEYLSIKGISGKAAYDWVAPAILTVITAAIFILLKIPVKNLFVDGGFIKSIVSFISNLPGFYIAALAAIATFNRAEIDLPLISNTKNASIEIKVTKENGKVVNSEEILTRRLFLCMLFSFLTASSIVIIILNAVSAPLIMTYPNIYFLIGYAVLFTFLAWQLLVSTFFGLYYLGNRIHMNY
ncbi:hypothetical protein AOZ94_12630 [Salmonella enterica subsp. enterica serovar Newport]|uniref:Uncharacterized protein n=1 Tax=Salmonella newport TaxID=108619 RepID=A0A616SJP8_SALNE|nr:hypothetical protein [Salmonella enterica]EBP3685672.1 hypothetical protein [Salmonella enterica subsp. enterica]EBX9487003.1 hypothetical protein [Salmonella enterica subsp. enterica serovar Rubislaw]HAU6688851.1 hypothetical protein [Salmonella enterica subsp. enterica serovar Hartford]EAX5886867.1 hypothetical protein [Salmonella enterica]EAY9462151.1 hypothetical protein [Salmonella enterica]